VDEAWGCAANNWWDFACKGQLLIISQLQLQEVMQLLSSDNAKDMESVELLLIVFSLHDNELKKYLLLDCHSFFNLRTVL
jgi:hypothetical protein